MSMKHISGPMADVARGVGAPDPWHEPSPEVHQFHSRGRDGRVGQASIPMSPEEMAALGYKLVTNYRGERVWVSPLCHIYGEAVYPPVELPPGDKRRAAEAAIEARYQEYRRTQGRAERTGGRYRRDEE